MGISPTLSYIAQQWIPSFAVKLAKPLTPIGNALAGICMHTGEKFTFNKGPALTSASIGVSLSDVPALINTQSGV